MSSAESSEESDLAGNTNNETKIILAVVCLLGMVAIGAEVWFHFSKQDAIEKANALRAQLATQVPVKSAETDQALLQPIDAEPVDAAMVPAVTTLQSGTEARNEAPVADANVVSSMDARKASLEKPKATLQISKSPPTTLRQGTRQIARKQPAQTSVTQSQSKIMQAKTVANQKPLTPTPANASAQTSKADSASGLPPVVDRSAVIASARTGGTQRGVKSKVVRAENNSSARSVWQQLRNDMKTKGGKADFCNDAVRSLNQCP